MNFDEIKQLLDMVREHELSEFELERDDFKIRVRKNTSGQWTATMPPMPHVNYAPVMTAPMAAPPAGPAPPVLTPAQEDTDFAVVKSPIVGTFYRAPEPGAKPFADVGDTVRKGQVLCIIEAMKLMNEINSDVDGEVVKVYVENGQPVQYGERLFAIRPL
jgi:acetyl-CoA carboxylase biotin carboxyl carrier protein